jgi:bifunctional non-homologous end joining protein LigD
LHIKKDARKGRVLIDIYRIRSGQSIVSPYSLRGRNGGPVSMPLTWDELRKVTNPKEFNIRNAYDKVIADGDAWDGINAFAVELHTHRTEKAKPKKLPLNKKHKTPEQLETYEKKRDFEKTPEPKAQLIPGGNNNFVIHRHHASHLHYDLRLEQDGVLKSWAVPRGFPQRPGVKRLAVQTEDHPMEYLTFDGKIPKGQYGAGEMWVYAMGKYEITKEKKDGFYFKLNSKEITGEYRIYRIKPKEYLMELVDPPQIDWLKDDIEPMLSDTIDKVPVGDEYLYELKWDGIRALIAFEDGKVRIRTRNQNDITAQFPELQVAEKAFRGTCGLFDAEIICVDKTGRPEFKKVISRMMANGESNILKQSRINPSFCYIFDCLYLDGRPLINDPLWKRKEWLKDAVKFDTPYRVSEFVDDGESLFNAAKEHSLEGIMVKRRDGKYLAGKRSDLWRKVKVQQSGEVYIIGFTPGNGDRAKTFGALHIAERVGDELYYRGKVGTGFDEALMKDIFQVVSAVTKLKRPTQVIGKLLDEKISTWIEPSTMAEVTYSRITPDKMFREPVFLRLRPDLV